MAHFTSSETKQINAKQEADVSRRMIDAGLRFADMDDMGVDVQLVMPPPTQLYHTVALEYAVPAARMINEDVVEFVSTSYELFHSFRHGADARRSGICKGTRALR